MITRSVRSVGSIDGMDSSRLIRGRMCRDERGWHYDVSQLSVGALTVRFETVSHALGVGREPIAEMLNPHSVLDGFRQEMCFGSNDRDDYTQMPNPGLVLRRARRRLKLWQRQ